MYPIESNRGCEPPRKRKGKPEERTPEQVGGSDDKREQHPWIEKEGPPDR